MARKGKQPSVMKHQFARVEAAQIPRSSFDRSHGVKTTFNGGWLVPVYIDEALPGDVFNLRMSAFARLNTPIHPIMDNMYLDSFFFAVPVRLVWDNWQKFHGEQIDPGDSIDYTIPQTSSVTGYTAGQLSDQMGLPLGVPGLSHSSLWHRAYNLIWNEWFRDQNLQQSLPVPKDDGPDDATNFKIMQRRKRHDYFTSCLPWPQKGESVLLPLGEAASVRGIGTQSGTFSTTPASLVKETGQYPTTTTYSENLSGGQLVFQGIPGLDWPNIYADLSTATAATINELRQAFQVQKLQERDARGGTRYTEIIRAHFGVVSPDARLQRPEYLGGGTTPVNIAEVPQTSSTDATTPQGNLAAYGTVHVRNNGFTKSFTEHCLLIGLVNVRADLTYQYGMNRQFNRKTRFDYYYPALSHIGEQAVLNKEIYAQGSNDLAADEAVFGYQERYAEYRYKPSEIHGDLRSTASAPLDVWHLARKEQSLPVLGDPWIADLPPIDRVVATPDEPHFKFDAYFNLQCARPMPLYGTPGLIDHF